MKQAKEKRVYLSQEDVPAYSLEEALRVPQAIFDNYGKQPTAPLKVAAAMNLAPGSSQFKMLCGAAIAYGFTTGGYNAATIGIESIAKRILAPTDEGDDLAAKREAFVRPRVIKQFVEKYNNSPLPKEEIGKNVLDEFGVPRNRAGDVLKTIIESAEKLGLVQDIKGKKYLSVDAIPVAPENNEASPDKDESNDVVQPRFAPAAIQVPVVHTNGSNGHNAAHDTARAKRVFVTHGKNKAFVDPIKKLLQFGELEAIVSVERQSVSEPVPEKVMNDMRSCGAAIIHVEGELQLIDKEMNEHIVLNPNVLIEIGGAMALYGKRFILLVKDGVKLPSNLQGLYEVRYTGETLDGNVTIKLLEAINDLKRRPLIGSIEPEAK
jgi:predicted nucleotide-binding protein